MIELAGGELLTERKGSVQWILFNRVEARNAFTWAMYDALAAQCAAVNEDRSIRVLVLAGNGGTFAAGTDISQFREFRTLRDAIDYEARVDHVAETVESVRVPVIAAISGACTGGGATIATCCDIRIASPSARFGVPIARTLGNCLSHQSYTRLFTALGMARTKELLMTGRLMNAGEMLSSAYVIEVVAGEEDLFPRAQSLAETIAANAPLTLEVSKRALRRVRDRLFPVEQDADIIETCYLSEDFHEGVEAFLAKRKPSWKGR